MLKNGCGQPGHGTLKLTVSQNWTDKTTWFFCMLVQMQEGWKLIQSFLSVPCQRWQWLFSSWDPKTCILKMNIWIELNILMLIVMQKFLVRLISYSLVFKFWGSTAVVLLVSFVVDYEVFFYLRNFTDSLKWNSMKHCKL